MYSSLHCRSPKRMSVHPRLHKQTPEKQSRCKIPQPPPQKNGHWVMYGLLAAAWPLQAAGAASRVSQIFICISEFTVQGTPSPALSSPCTRVPSPHRTWCSHYRGLICAWLGRVSEIRSLSPPLPSTVPDRPPLFWQTGRAYDGTRLPISGSR